LIAVNKSGRVKGFSVSENIKKIASVIVTDEKILSDEVVELGKQKIEL
jgi:hypothetical protein